MYDIVCIVLLLIYLIFPSDAPDSLLIAAGLFAIAGAIDTKKSFSIDDTVKKQG